MADPVWLLLMFDVPVKTKAQSRAATHLRNTLKDRGFSRIQFSIYAKYLTNATAAIPLQKEFQLLVPPSGSVRILKIPDRQWASMIRFEGPVEAKPEEPPEQLILF